MSIVPEVALGLTVAGWFLSPNINRLMEVSRSYASSNYKQKEKLQKLVQEVENIKGSLPGEVNDQTRPEHVWWLKDAIHDAEEILELFELGKQSGVSRKSRGYKLVEVLENLCDMAQALKKDSHRNGGRSVLERTVTAPYRVRNKKLFFGYAEQYIQLVSMLQLDGNKVDSNVIAIIGHGGMGKTELARQAFRAVEGEFDLSIWVHAYDKKKPIDLLNGILESIHGCTQVAQTNLPFLQKELRQKLTSKRCLLVLDDVWNDEKDTRPVEMKQARDALDSFTGFLKDGSRIVVTTRAKICSRTLRADATSIVLNGIKPEEITLLLNDTAGFRTDDTAGDPRIQELINKQVPKLKGSPLAAIEIGCKLKEQTTSYTGCCNILDNIKHHISSVYEGHRISYHHLPPHLQRCFAFCSIFPYNWRFEPDMLAKMWTAHGFVERTGEKSHMEGVARGYFDSLVDRSLFQKEVCTVEAGKQTCYVIHEHIHWMLRQDTAKNCVSVSRTTEPKNIPATVRHLSVTSRCLGKLKKFSIRLSNVRTLLVIEEEDNDDDYYYDANDVFVDTASTADDDRAHLITTITKDILQFKDVRVLDLTGTGITELPASIGKLKYVRYLGLPDTISTNLDDLDTKLPFLQTLIHSGKGNTETQKEVIANTSGRGEAVILTDSGLARAEQRPRPTTSATVPVVLEPPKDLSATPQDIAPIGCVLTVAVVGWFLLPHITELMKVARDCATTNYMLYWGGKKKLEKLVQDLEDIKRLLDPASTTFVNNQAKLDRLWRLKDDIHDIEEILDSFQVEIRNDEATSSSNLIKKKKIYDNKVKSMEKLIKVLKSVGETRNRARELLHGAPSSILARTETGPYSVRDQKSFFGYQEEYAQLVNMLWQQPDGNKVDGKMQLVIAILGHAGMGKTELARRAFRDAKGKFDRRIWVHAYGKNTEFDLLKEIWKSVAGHNPVGDMNVACLQKELEKLLVSKRCLLVLDDVWNHESAISEEQRKQAVVALDLFTRFTQDGSRVVMTTRAKICSETFKADTSIILNGIKAKEMTFLLNHTANGTTENSDQRIQELIDKQVPKLKGSPLAAVEIGVDLKEKTTRQEKCNIFDEIERHLRSVYQQHLFTYHHLPPHLQRCFQFCSIFPYNWRFEPEKLTKMWMALGFVEDKAHPLLGNGVRSMEDVARGYFDDLVDRSLFQLEQSKGGGDKQAHYVIHEQIHWMIRLASDKNCISIPRRGAAPKSIPATVRHLSVASNCLDELKTYPSWVLNKMRTLLVLKNDDDSMSSTFDKCILKLFKGVRVLDLTAATGLTHLPGTIHNLKHVRYLGLPSTMRNLCDEVTGLLFLQTFSLDGKKQNTCRLQRFPKRMNRLVNMRHLDIDMECIANISGIGRMAKLQGSIEFKAVRASEKEGHAMSELAGMNSLQETLSIKGLDTVASKEEAMKARLENKSAVKVLKLEWGPPNAAAVTAPAVLDGLQPHPHLHELCITRYPGETSPNWLSGLEKLTRLYLKNCSKLKDIPDVGRLPSLELLDIKGLNSVERIGSTGMFPKLNRIMLDNMPELVAWDNMPELAFPQLTEVIIVNCPLLSSLSGLECCRCALNMRVKGCPAITSATLPTSFGTGVSTCRFQ